MRRVERGHGVLGDAVRPVVGRRRVRRGGRAADAEARPLLQRPESLRLHLRLHLRLPRVGLRLCGRRGRVLARVGARALVQQVQRPAEQLQQRALPAAARAQQDHSARRAAQAIVEFQHLRSARHLRVYEYSKLISCTLIVLVLKFMVYSYK